MRAINHAVTGAFIGLMIHQPVVAIPVAVLSHFVCDVLPHYGPAQSGLGYLKSARFKQSLVYDAVACFALVVILAAFQPAHWFLAAVCAFGAAAPDLLSFGRWVAARRGKVYHPGVYSRFASNIQWFERPIGGVVELVWFFVFGILFLPMFLLAK